MPTIPPPATVLVTGANGYIGLWVVLELLARGYIVRGAVRSASKVDVLAELVARKQPEARHRFKGYVVPDITAVCDVCCEEIEHCTHPPLISQERSTKL